MMAGPNRSYRLQGWMVSALVHGLALPVALGLMAQVKPVPPKEAFTWDVALVEPQRTRETSQAEMTPAQEPLRATPRPVTPSPIQPKKVKIQSRKVTSVVQQEIRK